ncbi:MAG TPA: efflux RND transporter periplasmic adaptor subunit [Longimicrobiales bacterium]|nr:efflux RND transporter periplasmic adaptor subunit [Longimicrobiales bacterium]
MASQIRNKSRAWLRSAVLFGGIVVVGGGIVALRDVFGEGAHAEAVMAEPAQVVTASVAQSRTHRGSTTAIGTVLATRSITLRNELPGTVRWVGLKSGQVVGAGTVLVALDVSVEEAELRALQARADLAQTTLERTQRMAARQAVSAIELDNARAERDVALAEIARIEAVIARKTIRAPFRARVGIADVHPGQFLEAGALLTTLQGVDDEVNVDFTVPQDIAATLRPGGQVEVVVGEDEALVVPAQIVAVDARVDPVTRNAVVRARIRDALDRLAPGSSVRVRVGVGAEVPAVTVPVTALRKGPGGDHVFVLADVDGQTRAQLRRVESGPVVGDSVVILSGLEAGERIAASGSFKLRDGVLVQVSDGTQSAQAGR